jgi:GT2 family glycosyltransferase
MRQHVDVVVVNWNAGSMLRECIDSVFSEAREVIGQVVVVDNASTDNSMSSLPQAVVNLTSVLLSVNSGFARGCNTGAKSCSSPYILFLNPDAALHPDCLQRSIAFLESPAGQQVGICGVKLIDDDGAVQHTCARFPSVRGVLGRALGLSRRLPGLFPPHFMLEFDHLHTRQVDQVMGAYFLVRRDLFEALGGFDERYFVYFEEVDFALRARQQGWSSVFLAEASAYHKGGGTSSQVKAHRLFYSVRSRLLFAFKHFGFMRAWTVFLISVVLEPGTRLARALLGRSKQDFDNTLRGYGMLWRDLPKILATPRHGKNITVDSSPHA